MRPKLLLVILSIAALAAAAWWWREAGEASGLGEAAHERTAAILAFGPRPPGSPALDGVRRHLRDELERCGWVTQGQPFERDTPVGRVKFENVRARFGGGGESVWEKRVDALLCAHVDSKLDEEGIFLGADDAASACAAIVEIARHLAEHAPERARRIELVFFDGEEAFQPNITPTDGLYGSRHYAAMWRGRDDRPRFGILLDMIGHRDLSIKLPSDSPPELRDAILAAAKGENAERHFGMAASPIIDDHVPLNFAGIPTVDVIGDFQKARWWHTPGDNLELISTESLDISMRVVLRALEDLLDR